MLTFHFSYIEDSKQRNIAQDVLKENNQWLNSLDSSVYSHTPANVVNHLRQLDNIKCSLIQKSCAPHIWPQCVLSNQSIKQYIVWAVEKSKSQEYEVITYWLKKIVSPVDLDQVTREFACNIQQLYCSSLETSVPEMIKVEGEHLIDLYNIVKNNVTEPQTVGCIEKYIKAFTNYMEKTRQKNEMLLLETLMLPLRYDAVSKKFDKAPNLYDIEHFNGLYEVSVKECFNIATENNTFKLQHCLFYLTVAAINCPDNIPLISHHISYLKEQLSNNLLPIIKAVLNACKNDYMKLKDYLQVIYKGPNWCTELPELQSNSNENMENNTSNKYILPKDSFLGSLHDVLCILHLTEKYPRRLTIQDVLIIKPEILPQDSNFKNLADIVLQKILTCDNRSRSFLLFTVNDSSKSDDEESEDDSDSEMSTGKVVHRNIHPLDVILSLLLCSDHFLRQVLLYKLSICQMAIPLLLPDTLQDSVTLLLWAMRSIKKTWKTIHENAVFSSTAGSIVDHECPIVSFLKCGDLQISKSELLNKVIGQEDIFFNWQLESQVCRKTIYQGVVELSCYYPSDTEIFKDVIIFTNLRGDAINCQYAKQVAFIKKISFVSFVLMKKEYITKEPQAKNLLQQLASSPGGVVILLTDVESCKKKKIKEVLQCDNFSLMCIKSKPWKMIQNEIRSYISSKLKGEHEKFNSVSSYVSTAREINITVDEDDAECLNGKEKALQVMKHVSDDVLKPLPLQGPHLWGAWTTYNKEFHRHKQKYPDKSVAEYKQLVDENKSAIRLLQIFCNFSIFTKEFLVNLIQLTTKERCFFLHWLKEFLNDKSKDTLPRLQKEYQETYLEIKRVSDANIEVNKRLKNLLTQKNRKLFDASFNVEHCFRELGQLYEAAKCTPQILPSSTISMLPKITAKALIDGFALEIMDGEVSHIPITWVKAIFDQLDEVYPNKKLFVLSILGIQSSGKSTLLNTMFGLQFNVSAGRCTRGVFIRILQIDKSLENDLDCDFIVVVDTEGIRAPELLNEEFEQHDNELATFVIGLADITIINIYGEAPADLNDILQTALHAFIRMKEVEIKPGCLFVHQNVTEKFANDKLKSGKQIFLNKLDKLTEVVAKEEACLDKYQKFKDIIEFDEDQNVYYFTGLWKGDPPMAPINFGYSQKAQQLKQALIKIICSKELSCSFRTFKDRILNLWDAILKEGFVFNFRNSIETSAYGDLDLNYNKWSWQLHEVLENELIKCDHKIKSCEFISIESIKSECIHSSSLLVNQKYEEVFVELESFFKTHEHAGVLSKHCFVTKKKLEELKRECHEKLKHHCKILEWQKENDKEKEEMLLQYKEKIRDEITELVAKSLPNLNSKNLFEESWDKWIDSFRKKIKYIPHPEDKQICIDIENNLTKTFINEQAILISQLKDSIEARSNLRHKRFKLEKCHINTDGFKEKSRIMTYLEDEKAAVQGIAESETDHFIQNASTAIKEKLTKLSAYNEALTEGMLKSLALEINTFNNVSKKFNFTSQYKVDIALHICVDAARQIKGWIEGLKKSSDPVLLLQKEKSKYFNIFNNQYSNIASEKAAANQLCRSLGDAIFNAVCKKMPTKVVSHLKFSKQDTFMYKKGFKVQVLKDLAAAENFERYEDYFMDSAFALQSWTKHYVENYCRSRSKTCNRQILMELANTEVDNIMTVLQDAVGLTITHHSSSEWLNQLCTTLSGKIEIKKREWIKDIQNVDKNPESIQSFKRYFNKEIHEMHTSGKISHQVNSTAFEIIDSASEALYLSIMRGTCTAQCPFCKEECDYTDSNHVQGGKLHRVSMHRPQCIGKATWHQDKKLVIEVCNSLVASKNDLIFFEDGKEQRIRYRDYQKRYPDWNIPGDAIVDTPKYWMWVVAHFYDKILSWTGGKDTVIPDVWKSISKSDAIEALLQS